MKTVHEIDPNFKSEGKRQLLACKECGIETLHVTAFYGMPFRCVAHHGATTLCDSCNTYVDVIAKVVVDSQGKYKQFCEVCGGPDTPEKGRLIWERIKKASEEECKPLDLNDPHSIARALGASAFTNKK